MQHFPIAPQEITASLYRNRTLILTLVQREVLGRYRGSVLGMLWSFFNPVLMLAVYTFVFSVVFNARWGTGVGNSKAEFALILFAGMLVFNLFADCIIKAPSLILGNAGYVKKVVFPLEILPWISFGAAFFHALISLIVWLLFSLFVFGQPKSAMLLFPLMLLPLTLLTMGLSWLLASLGVYLRDVAQVVGIVVTVCMFLTPIFYPLTAIPEAYRGALYLNPLTVIIEQSRDLLIFNREMAWGQFGILTLTSAIIAWLGFAWFQKTRKGFADVL